VAGEAGDLEAVLSSLLDDVGEAGLRGEAGEEKVFVVEGEALPAFWGEPAFGGGFEEGDNGIEGGRGGDGFEGEGLAGLGVHGEGVDFAGFGEDAVDDHGGAEEEAGRFEGGGFGDDVPGDGVGDALGADGAELLFARRYRCIESDLDAELVRRGREEAGADAGFVKCQGVEVGEVGAGDGGLVGGAGLASQGVDGLEVRVGGVERERPQNARDLSSQPSHTASVRGYCEKRSVVSRSRDVS
jgi:hypothetical protein